MGQSTLSDGWLITNIDVLVSFRIRKYVLNFSFTNVVHEQLKGICISHTLEPPSCGHDRRLGGNKVATIKTKLLAMSTMLTSHSIQLARGSINVIIIN